MVVTGGRARRVVVALLVVYLAAVARVTLWPEFATDDAFGAVDRAARWLSARGLPVTLAGLEAVSNVVMFVPFGVLPLLLIRDRGRWWPVVPVAAVASGLIETTQLLLLPTRVATVQDVVLNTLGAVLGLAATVVVDRRRQRRRAGTGLPQEVRSRPAVLTVDEEAEPATRRART